jgi:hypothetical protein
MGPAGKVLWFLAFAVFAGVATGLILHRIILGVIVGAGILLLGIIIAINRSEPVDPEI